MEPTAKKEYTFRLIRASGNKWKTLLDVQAPYRWNLKRLNLGRTLDVGCGIGRNLRNLGNLAVGVDHNQTSIIYCREQGLSAFTTEEFHASFDSKHLFDSLLFSHVVEHMSADEAAKMLRSYFPYLKSKGKVVIIAPQVAGYKSDPTHVEYFDFKKIKLLYEAVGLHVDQAFSFPFPEFVGHFFRYNEFCVVGTTS